MHSAPKPAALQAIFKDILAECGLDLEAPGLFLRITQCVAEELWSQTALLGDVH
jgi:hypothetical protein